MKKTKIFHLACFLLLSCTLFFACTGNGNNSTTTTTPQPTPETPVVDKPTTEAPVVNKPKTETPVNQPVTEETPASSISNPDGAPAKATEGGSAAMQSLKV